ncbi:MAG: heme ABC exporter ATP-binding protein CcmA [Planctomycetaceae bacterium]|nr:heme ABC exporter ATP-binding protein CcmA [Planctomycetaceae bacterium]
MLRSFPSVTSEAAPSSVPSGPRESRLDGRPAVTAANLSVAYGRVPVLREIDLQVAAGECVALMGPNGAGKSTLLGCLVGVVRPACGEVSLFGKNARNRDARRQVGFAGQEPGLYAELSARENLIFSGRMYGVQNVNQHVSRLLEESNLTSAADRPVAQLSQGMRQRVAVLRAMVHQPQLVVLDEPSARLDTAGKQWLASLLTRCRDHGQTVCFASHDVAQCRTLADRIVQLDAGRIVAIDPGRVHDGDAWLRSA